MAGAGFKTFNTGDVLTASDVNTYLMQQTVMVFASAAARTTALGANVAEGMLSYLKDTDQVEVYNGTSWVASDDPNAIQNSIFDAKGDLIVGTGNDTYVRQAIGSNGSVLIADSSQADGLQWGDNYGFTAGKNKIINGNFGIWQRGTSFTATGYSADRWYFIRSNTTTLSQQSFTAGSAPVTGYEGTFFCRLARSAGSGDDYFIQRIEDVRTFANQTATISFWAKADTATTISEVYFEQNFGSGGSTSVGAGNTAIAITTSWARYTLSVSVPSISGKTIGTGSFLGLTFKLASAMGNRTIDIWGVQVEAGSVATAFQTATGTIQGELAACQRYYWRSTSNGANSNIALGFLSGTSNAIILVNTPVTMRVTPTSVDFASQQILDSFLSTFSVSSIALSSGETISNPIRINATVSGATQGRACAIRNDNSTSGYIGFSAEL